MMKLNCWEFKKCGREEGGSKVDELGVCNAATDTHYDGKNNGKNAGRKCWHIDGTLCGGNKQGKFGEKAGNCLKCEFFKFVKEEEDHNFEW